MLIFEEIRSSKQENKWAETGFGALNTVVIQSGNELYGMGTQQRLFKFKKVLGDGSKNKTHSSPKIDRISYVKCVATSHLNK